MANFVLAYAILLAMEIPSGIGLDWIVGPMVGILSMTIGVFVSYGMLFTDPGALSGVVGIVSVGGSFVGSSLMRLAIFTAFLSVNLGLFNLFPIPALDGGKALFAILEKVSPKVEKVQIPVTVASVIFLITLMSIATIKDLIELIF